MFPQRFHQAVVPRDVIADRDCCKLGGYVVGGAVRMAQVAPFHPGDRGENRRGLLVEIRPDDNRNPPDSVGPCDAKCSGIRVLSVGLPSSEPRYARRWSAQDKRASPGLASVQEFPVSPEARWVAETCGSEQVYDVCTG